MHYSGLMTTYTESPALPDHVLTETEFEDSDVAVLRQELADADAAWEAAEAYYDEQARAYASMLWNER